MEGTGGLACFLALRWNLKGGGGGGGGGGVRSHVEHGSTSVHVYAPLLLVYSLALWG